MTRLQRITNFAISLLMIACGIGLLLDPQDSLMIVAFVLGFALMLYGLRMLVYFVTMARHMVGGLSILFIAVITIDIGVFALALIDNPHFSIVLYLVLYNTYASLRAIARGVESKMSGSRWILSIAHGLVNIALAVLCLVFISSDQIVIAIFCFGLFYSALTRLISALRPTEIIYIQ